MARQKPMKVLILGLPRTGTKSLCAALRRLGLNPYHWEEVVKNKHFELWLEAIQAKYDGLGEPFKGRDMFDLMLCNYDAVSASPSYLFSEELIAAYPDAKIILTTRPNEEWLQSLQKAIIPVLSWKSWPVFCYFDRDFCAIFWPLISRTYAILSGGIPPYKPCAYPALVQSFEKHNDHIRRIVPKQKLLEFNPSHGWEPLCAFLSLPVPEGEFPHIRNSAHAVRPRYWEFWYIVAQKLAKKLLAMGVMLAIVMWLCWG
ncbi:hypothetical protein HIM_10223 [Hirsutella minnesotensis 3608]|uniref:P-loop containing nucleoside triphosphate hydrolase protein n=1 Tax=Hirsutella minnesotensis 3608 TaxID=1043627 RepID=A0A0F8A2H8_9HYPO|nr:hypothetical protein HIM_10223 [Hirsutella minnesotensis 3608]